jgi:hypothetical protein
MLWNNKENYFKKKLSQFLRLGLNKVRLNLKAILKKLKIISLIPKYKNRLNKNKKLKFKKNPLIKAAI